MVIDVPESNEEPAHNQGAAPSVLPHMIRIAVPIGSILVLVAFAVTALLPSNRGPIPTQSTLLFIPIYIAIVVVLVFASMYIFKRVMEEDVTPEGHWS
jgi:amino acid permease